MPDLSANKACLAAIEMMGRLHVEPRPHNYELFYKYVTEESPDLRGTIDLLIENEKISDPVALEAAYAKFCAPPVPPVATEALTEISNKLSAQIAATLGITERAAASSAQFGSKLAGSINEMNEHQLAGWVDGVLKAATMMEQQSAGYTENLVGMQRQVEELQEEVSVIRQASLTDPLTGVGNRRFFDDEFENAIMSARLSDKRLSLCLIDLDHFKKLNDKHGHATGDAALRKVADIIRKNVRPGDIVARYGGEEFVVVLSNTAVQEAVNIVDRIRVALSTMRLVKRTTGETLDPLTASFGITELSENDTGTSMFERADEYLYSAKHKGRNRIEVGVEGGVVLGEIISRIRAAHPTEPEAPQVLAS